MRKNYTTFILLLSIMAALVSVGTGLFFFRIIRHTNEHTSNVLYTLEMKMEEREKSGIDSEAIGHLEEIHGKINAYFINPLYADSFADSLENIGVQGDATVSVKQIRLSPEDPNLMLMDISLEGSFANVMNAISRLENMPYQIHIHSSDLNRQESLSENKSAKAPSWRADISLSVLASSS
ncbi:MAG: hypothetical protein V4665_01900 [Patescibacteria group bacterium]